MFETLTARTEGSVLFADIAAPPMNLLGPELVRDLVSLIEQAEADDAGRVVVFRSGDPAYFISHVPAPPIATDAAASAMLRAELGPTLDRVAIAAAARIVLHDWWTTRGPSARAVISRSYRWRDRLV